MEIENNGEDDEEVEVDNKEIFEVEKVYLHAMAFQRDRRKLDYILRSAGRDLLKMMTDGNQKMVEVVHRISSRSLSQMALIQRYYLYPAMLMSYVEVLHVRA